MVMPGKYLKNYVSYKLVQLIFLTAVLCMDKYNKTKNIDLDWLRGSIGLFKVKMKGVRSLPRKSTFCITLKIDIL